MIGFLWHKLLSSFEQVQLNFVVSGTMLTSIRYLCHAKLPVLWYDSWFIRNVFKIVKTLYLLRLWEHITLWKFLKLRFQSTNLLLYTLFEKNIFFILYSYNFSISLATNISDDIHTYIINRERQLTTYIWTYLRLCGENIPTDRMCN